MHRWRRGRAALLKTTLQATCRTYLSYEPGQIPMYYTAGKAPIALANSAHCFWPRSYSLRNQLVHYVSPTDKQVYFCRHCCSSSSLASNIYILQIVVFTISGDGEERLQLKINVFFLLFDKKRYKFVMNFLSLQDV